MEPEEVTDTDYSDGTATCGSGSCGCIFCYQDQRCSTCGCTVDQCPHGERESAPNASTSWRLTWKVPGLTGDKLYESIYLSERIAHAQADDIRGYEGVTSVTVEPAMDLVNK